MPCEYTPSVINEQLFVMRLICDLYLLRLIKCFNQPFALNPFLDFPALVDLPYISRSSAVRPNLQTLAPIQSSISLSQDIFGLPLFLRPFTFHSNINFSNVRWIFTQKSTTFDTGNYEAVFASENDCFKYCWSSVHFAYNMFDLYVSLH